MTRGPRAERRRETAAARIRSRAPVDARGGRRWASPAAWIPALLVVALIEQGDVQGAIAQFSEAVRLKPDYAKAHNNLGILLYRQGRTREAVAHFAEAARLDPSFTEAWSNLRAAQGGR